MFDKTNSSVKCFLFLHVLWSPWCAVGFRVGFLVGLPGLSELPVPRQAHSIRWRAPSTAVAHTGRFTKQRMESCGAMFVSEELWTFQNSLKRIESDWACIPTTSYEIKMFRLKSGLGKRETSKLREMWSRSRWSGQCLVCPWIDWVLPGSDALSHLRVDFEAQLSFSSEEGVRFSWHPRWWNHHWLASRIVHAACMPTAFFGWNMLKLPIYSFHLFSSLFQAVGVKGWSLKGPTHVAQAFQGDPYRPCLVLRPEVARRERGRQGETEDVRRFDHVLWWVRQMAAKATKQLWFFHNLESVAAW